MEGGDDFFKKRLEKDLAELKKMIDTHFGKFQKSDIKKNRIIFSDLNL